MDEEQKRITAATGMDAALVDKLDQILVDPEDRAYFVCTFLSCKHNLKGRCTIFAVQDVPRMKTNQPCSRYEG